MHKNQRAPVLSNYSPAHTKGWSGRYELYSQSKRPFGPSVTTFGTWTHTFDPTGAVTDFLCHHADIEHHSGKLVSLDSGRSYVYDANKKLIRAIHYDPDGTGTRATLYSCLPFEIFSSLPHNLIGVPKIVRTETVLRSAGSESGPTFHT